MEILFFIDPSESHGIPLNAARGMIAKLPKMVAGLKAAGCKVDLLSGQRAARHMQDTSPGVFDGIDRVFLLDGANLDRMLSSPDGASALTMARPDPASVERASGVLQTIGCTGPYDIVISPFTETAFLQALFPKSRVLFFETGLVCHLPFAQFHVFDPFGTYRTGAYFARLRDADMDGDVEGYAPVLEQLTGVLRSFSRRFIEEAGGRRRLRGRFSRVVLLPLQVTDNPSFRGSVAFLSQFALLEHVLRRLPEDIGLLVSEHPSYPQITALQHEYLQQTYPNYIYYPRLQSLWSPSGVLLPIVDAVIGVSSTVLLQAHALGLRTFALGTGSFTALNQNPDLGDFLTSLQEGRAFDTPRRQILNMIARYSVPQDLYQSPDLARYLGGILATPPDGVALPVIAPPDQLMTFYQGQDLPKTLIKGAGFYSHGWASAPLALTGEAPFPDPGPAAPRPMAPKMTVTVLLDHFGIGGTQRVVQRLIDRMPDLHWILLVETRIDQEFEARANCDIVTCEPGPNADETARRITATLSDIHRATPIDVLVNPMHWRPAALKAMAQVKRQLKIPVVYWEHNSFYFPFYTAHPDLHKARAECLPGVDRTVLLGDHDRALFQSHFPLAATQVIRNPVPDFASEPTPHALREKIILVVGRFDPQKRMDRAIPIMAALRNRCPGWRMVLLGDGYLHPAIGAEIKAQNLDEVIELEGYDDQPGKFYAKASILALLSDFEGDPLTLMEAKAHGLPVVLFELFQNTRLRDGIDGLVAEQGNIAQFVDHLARLILDPALRHRLGQAGREDFLQAQDARPEDDWRQLFTDLQQGKPGATLDSPTLPARAVAEAVHVLDTLHRTMEERLQKRIRMVAEAESLKAATARAAANPAEVKALQFRITQLMRHTEADALLLKDRFDAIQAMEAMIKSRDAHIAGDAKLLKERLDTINDLATKLHNANRRVPWILRKIRGAARSAP